MTQHSLTISFKVHKYAVISINGNVLSFVSDLYLLYSLCRRCHNLCIYISVVLRVCVAPGQNCVRSNLK